MAIEDSDQLVPNPEGARILGISTRAKLELEKNDPQFPPTYRRNGRKYNYRRDLLKYIELRRAAPETRNPGWELTRTRPRVKGRFSATDNGDEEADSA
jgi:hypothetical protein